MLDYIGMDIIYWFKYWSKKNNKNKKWFWANFFLKLMNNAVFGKTMENIRKQRDITTEGRRKYLVSKPNYYTTFFPENLLVIELKKSQRLTNKAVSSGLSILELSKILTYNYVKQKYHEKATFCYMDIDSSIV